MNTPHKALLLGAAMLFGLGMLTPASAHYNRWHGGYRHNRVVVVTPTTVYAHRPYYHYRHHGRVIVGPSAVYAYRPYHPYHQRTVIVRRHNW